jgi:hypothetical protein
MAQYTAAELLLKAQASSAWNERWRFAWDMNGDGVTTISDTLLWLKWLFFAPGDWVLLMIMQHAPNIGVYFEMSPDKSLYGFGSAILSIFGWLWVWQMISGALENIGLKKPT